MTFALAVLMTVAVPPTWACTDPPVSRADLECLRKEQAVRKAQAEEEKRQRAEAEAAAARQQALENQRRAAEAQQREAEQKNRAEAAEREARALKAQPAMIPWLAPDHESLSGLSAGN